MESKFIGIHDNIIRNPSGKSYSAEERKEIRKILDERNANKKGTHVGRKKKNDR